MSIRFLLWLATLLFVSGLASQVSAETFVAPRFAPGTSFVIKVQTIDGRTVVQNLNFVNQNSDPEVLYDFDTHTLSAHMEIVRKGTTPRKIVPIRFPLSTAASWEYSVTYPASNAKCGTATETSRANAGAQLEKVRVAGRDFSVLRIQHNGTWADTCAKGTFTRTYLYDPALGMYIKADFRLYDADRKPLIGWDAELVSTSSRP